MYDETKFRESVHRIYEDHSDLFAITNKMANLTKLPLRTSYPSEYAGNIDDAWHAVPNGIQRPNMRPDFGSRYDGMLMKLTNSNYIFLILNGERRGFVSANSLFAYGYDFDLVYTASHKWGWEKNIPQGQDLPANPTDLRPDYFEYMKTKGYLNGTRYEYPDRKDTFERSKHLYFSQIKSRLRRR